MSRPPYRALPGRSGPPADGAGSSNVDYTASWDLADGAATGEPPATLQLDSVPTVTSLDRVVLGTAAGVTKDGSGGAAPYADALGGGSYRRDYGDADEEEEEDEEEDDDDDDADAPHVRGPSWLDRLGAGPRTRRAVAVVRENAVLVGTIVGALLGMLVGALVGQADPSPTAVMLLRLPGGLFLRMLKLLVVPLLMASIIGGVDALRGAGGGKLASRVFGLFLLSTVLAAFLGIVLVMAIQPGRGGLDAPPGEVPLRNVTATDAVVALFYSLVPENLVGAAADMDMLGLISFSLAFGAAATVSGEGGRRMLQWASDVNTVTMRLVHWVMYLTPIGVFSLLAGRLAQSGSDFWSFVASLGLYMVTVLTGLLLQSLVMLPAIYFAFARRNPYRYSAHAAQALLTAFGTSSSAATLPITIRDTMAAGVPEELARFVLPLGATINMAGTALYEGVAAGFIAQLYGIELGWGGAVIVMLTACLAAIGAAGIPEAGLVTMQIVLTAAGLPVEGIAYLLPVDWLLDRCRTVTNVHGDIIVAGAVHAIQARKRTKRGRAPAGSADAGAGAGADGHAIAMMSVGASTQVLSMEDVDAA